MKHLFLLAFFVFFSIPSPVHALSSDWQKDDSVGIRLLSGVDGVGQLTVVPLAIDVELAPDWHTYWRSPGEAGLPPQIDWQSDLNDTNNLKSANLLYPAPKRYTAFGLETVGYRDHVVLPIDAEVREPGHALILNPAISLLVCSAVCVPKNIILHLTIPEGTATESSEASTIKEFRDHIPADAAKSGFVIQSFINRGKSLSVILTSRDTLQAPDMFVENDNNIAFTAPVVTLGADMHSAELKIKPVEALPTGKSLADLPLDLTITDGENALEQHITVPAVTITPIAASSAPPSLILAIFLAILGGFILNLMPCVLPVLSLKVLSVISHGGGEKRTVRQSFLMSAAGIVFSYLVLAGVTIILKMLGMAFGWGVQFQQPLFLIFLITLLVFFAANLWELFEIPLPRFLADTLTGPYHPKLAGDFAAGALATLLATPCSAPFLGTAIGFALTSSIFNILIIFTMLGFGMTLPYLAIAAFPGLATALPKPGHWMNLLKCILGWSLALTALWLVWVLAAQITEFYAALVGLSMVAIIALLALRRRSSKMQNSIMYTVTLVTAMAFSLVVSGSSLPKAAPNTTSEWLPFDEHTLEIDVAEGKTVFVDVTADWCLTCKANKKFILSQNDLSQRLFHSNIVAMQADWTNPDPIITAFLQKFQRYGIPFNAVFGPSAPQGLVLPELLSIDAVTQALDKASKPLQE